MPGKSRQAVFMETMRNFIGYVLGFLLFVCGIPALMWWASGRAWNYFPENAWRGALAIILMVLGLALSVYTIVYMKKVGKGNPFVDLIRAHMPMLNAACTASRKEFLRAMIG